MFWCLFDVGTLLVYCVLVNNIHSRNPVAAVLPAIHWHSLVFIAIQVIHLIQYSSLFKLNSKLGCFLSLPFLEL